MTNSYPIDFVTRDGREIIIDLARPDDFKEMCDFSSHHFF